MRDRWKMNRLGLINIWFYDREVFEFEDGKLLLRGQNGSGKSITTQSFIPFILDGDRTPSRLDPFGSADRKMDYYFLGDNKEESTGYLFLEFKKENEESYRTIAIGQNARRGKGMTFWGFVILDNRRVEIDLKFYRESGDKIIPYDRTEMKKVLGEDTPFTTSQREYKEWVNKYLFGFEKVEQYEQLLKFLIKIRSQKLSGVLKPTKIYEILNESLQVLSDDDLRPMVEAMEKMDSMQENLEGLKRSLTNASAILREYTHYNRYILSKKADRYLEATSVFEKSYKKYEEYSKKVTQWEADLNEKKLLCQKLEAEETNLKNELEQLSDPELENLDLKLQNAKSNLAKVSNNRVKKENQIQEKNEQILETERKIRDFKSELDYVCEKMNSDLQDLDVLQKELQADFHVCTKKYIEDGSEENRQLVQSKMTVLKENVQKGRFLLSKTKESQEAYEVAVNEENENTNMYELLLQKQDDFENAKEAEQDHLMNALYAMRENVNWIPKKETIEQAAAVIENYQSNSDYIQFHSILRKDMDACVQVKNEQLASVVSNEKQIRQSIHVKEAEYAEIQNQKEVEPERDADSERSRQLLMNEGIEAYPFYQTVDFSEHLSEKEKAVLEQQLIKAGILDALVVSDEAYQQIQRKYPNLLDVVLYMNDFGDSVYSDLIADTSLSASIQQATKRILSHFSLETGTLVLKHDGYFQHGLLEGRVNKEQSEFIGASARKRRKEMILQQILEEINTYKDQLSEVLKQKEKLYSELERVQKEFTEIPDFTKLNALLDEMHSLDIELDECRRKKEILEKKTRSLYDAFKSVERKMLEVCNLLPYTRDTEAYDDVLEDLDTYKETFHSLCMRMKDKESAHSQIMIQEEYRDRALEEIDILSFEKSDLENTMHGYEEQIRQIEDILNRPETLERASKLKEIHQKQDENKQNLEKVKGNILLINHDLGESEEKSQELEEQVAKCRGALEKYELYLQEELDLGILMEKSEEPLLQRAKQAAALAEENYKSKSNSEMLNSLRDVFSRNMSDLTNYNARLDKYFALDSESDDERVRFVMTLVWLGKKLTLNEFVEQLQLTIASQEELISQKDRELFEDILSQTISKKLTEKIDESRTLIRQMSSLMRNMDTSMGLSFSLEWKPVIAEENEMDVRELEKILIRDKALITAEDEERVAKHFRSIIKKEKERMELNGVPNYMDLVRNALDYRKWYSFKMSYAKANEAKKELTNAAFNRFSGGERAMAMYVPLLAAVNAQYQKAKLEDHPRLIAVDEAFAGVDEKNIASMFEMVEKFDFDYIMNSQALWGCYETVKHLKISELLRPLNAEFVTVINYVWDGKEKKMV